MPVTVKDVGDMFGKDVFTERGFYAGKVSDLEFDLSKFKIKALVIEAARGSMMEKLIGDKKGIIIPYAMINAIGDVVLVKHFGGEEEGIEDTENV